jgi:hypothetical protein
MNTALRAFVRERAGRRSEYCQLHEGDADFLAFHVAHVVAKQHGGRGRSLFRRRGHCRWPGFAGSGKRKGRLDLTGRLLTPGLVPHEI